MPDSQTDQFAAALAPNDGYTLITGAASGIGREFARALARCGHRLVLIDVQAEPLDRVAAELREICPDVRTLAHDLRTKGAARTIFNFCRQSDLDVSILINNAATGTYAPLHEQPLWRLEEMIRVNVTAVVELTRLFIPQMLERRRGAIINVTSIAAFESSPRWNVYGASKAFLQNLTESLQEELRGTGIYVAAVCPGMTRTNFFAAAGMQMPHLDMQTPQEVVDEALAGLSRGRPLIVTGRCNRIRIQAQRANLRRLLANIKGGLRRVGVLG